MVLSHCIDLVPYRKSLLFAGAVYACAYASICVHGFVYVCAQVNSSVLEYVKIYTIGMANIQVWQFLTNI